MDVRDIWLLSFCLIGLMATIARIAPDEFGWSVVSFLCFVVTILILTLSYAS